jgi:mRNA interferase MazF
MPARPVRGEVWLVDLGMAAKTRPCLVLSIPITDADRALVTLVPHTTSPRNSRLETPSDAHFLRSGVFDAQNLVTIPTVKLLRKLGVLPAVELAAVESAVRFWLGL